MSEVHKFLFDGMPVRGILVRLTDAWQEVLSRRKQAGAYPVCVTQLLGEMTAASVLLQSGIQFNGSLILQLMGQGALKLAVAEVQSDLSLRATATVTEADWAAAQAATHWTELVDAKHAQCAMTLDPKDRQPGQSPYQGVVPLVNAANMPAKSVAEVIEHYMRQSEQLDTRLVLAANEQVAAGLLIQRIPIQGEMNLEQTRAQDIEQADEDFHRIAVLASSLQPQELLELDADTVLHRLFWQEAHSRFEPLVGDLGPKFACSCSRERVSGMLRNLGAPEVESIVAEQGQVQVACEFCGTGYVFDPVDAAELFVAPANHLQASQQVQ